MKVTDDLRTIREEYDEYLLEDGNTLKCKQCLITFATTGEIKKDESGKEVVKTQVSLKFITAVVPTADIDTSDLKQVEGAQISKSDAKKSMKFEKKKSFLNFYETDEFVIMVRCKVIGVWTTPFQDMGIPIYYVEGTGALDAQQKKKIAPIKEPES